MVEYAKSQGIYTIVTDYLQPEDSRAKLLADEYWMISTGDYDALEKKCREEEVNAICSGIAAFNIEASLELCKRLDLPRYCDFEPWHYTMNKGDFKALCRECNVPVATDYFLSNHPSEEELQKIQLPVVVKAVDQSANRGMSYCFTRKEIIPAIEYAHTFSKSENVIIERMLHGIEYTAYYALAEGEASLVNLFCDLAQPGTPNNCYAVNSTACDKLDVYLKEIDPYFRNLLKKGGMKEGVCWIELILDEDGHFYVIEMGYRMSGDMMAIPISDVTGFNSYKWMVDIAMGIKHTKDDLPHSQNDIYKDCGCSYILWSDSKPGTVSKMEGVDEILSIPGVRLNPNVKINSSYRANQYLLTFTFTRSCVEDVISIIQKINETVKVFDENEVDVSMKFTDFDQLKDIYYCRRKQECQTKR